MHAVVPLSDESSGKSPLTVTVEYPGNGVVRINAATRVAIKRYNHAVTWATRYFISLISISKKYESNFKEISKLHLLVVIYECTSLQRKHSYGCTRCVVNELAQRPKFRSGDTVSVTHWDSTLRPCMHTT